MLRALQLMIVAMVALSAASAGAARVICEDGEDAPMSLPAALLRSSAAEIDAAGPPAPAPAPAPEPRLCAPGSSDPAACHPFQPAPAPGRSAAPLHGDAFVVLRPPALPPLASAPMSFAAAAGERLAPGFARRVDRPPRPF